MAEKEGDVYNILKIEDAVQGYIAITVCGASENRKYTVKASVYTNIGSPCRGEELSEEELEVLGCADEYYRAKRAALSILSYGDNNEKMLYTKLRARSISDKTANEVVSEMLALGYIDEQRQLARLISDEANRKLLGPRKITPKLISKGYSMSSIREALEGLVNLGEIDFGENRDRLLEKHLGDSLDEEEIKKLLFKYGYDF